MQTLTLDVTAAAVILLCAYLCYRGGFAHSVVRLLGWAAALIGSSLASRPAGEWIFALFIRGRALAAVEEQIRVFASPQELAANVETLLEGLPVALADSLRVNGAPLAQWVLATAESLPLSEIPAAVTDSLIAPMVISVLALVCFFVLFTVLGLLVQWLAGAMKLVNDLPVVGPVNAALGAVMGVLQGAALVYLLAMALRLAVLTSGDGLGFVREADAQSSALFGVFYNAGLPADTPLGFS